MCNKQRLPTRRWSRIIQKVAAGVAISVLVTSCGDDDDDSTDAAVQATSDETTSGAVTTLDAVAPTDSTAGSAAGSGDVCADREALRSSVDALRNVDVVAEGTNGVKAAVSDIKDALAALRSSAGAELRPQVQAVQDAVAEVETAIADLDSGGAVAVVRAVSGLATSARTLLDSLEPAPCGASTTPTT